MAEVELPKHARLVISNNEQVEILCQYVESEKSFIIFDIETGGLDWWNKETSIVGVGFGFFRDRAVYSFYLPSCFGLPDRIAQKLYCGVPKIGANIKFDSHFIHARYNLRLNPLHDIQVVARLLRTQYESVALDSLMDYEFQAEHIEWKELQAWCRANKIKCSSTYVEPGAYIKVPPDILGKYCCSDIYWTTVLYLKYAHELKNNAKLLSLYNNVERSLLYSVIAVEEAGVKVDIDYLKSLQIATTDEIERRRAKVFELVGKQFDIDSNPALKEVFVAKGVKSELRTRKKIENGKQVRVETESYDAACIEKQAKQFPFIDELLAYRYASKIKATYVDQILGVAVNKPLIFTSLRQESARTGRFGCSNPPLQTLPRETKDTKDYSIRRAILPKYNSVLLTVDLKQIEYCLLAHFSKDPELLKIFRAGLDFHGAVAAKLFDVPADQVTKEQRSVSKTFSFAQLYGSGIDNLVVKTGVPRQRCQQLIKQYNDTFPGVLDFKNAVERYVKANGGIDNPFGRHRAIPCDLSYTGVNSLIQGTAADMIKIAMIRVVRELSNLRSRLLFSVHDELVVNWHMLDGMSVVDTIIKSMTTFERNGKSLFSVPIEAEASICISNWAEKKAIGLLEAGDIHFFNWYGYEVIEDRLKNIGSKWLKLMYETSVEANRRKKTEYLCDVESLLEVGADDTTIAGVAAKYCGGTAFDLCEVQGGSACL